MTRKEFLRLTAGVGSLAVFQNVLNAQTSAGAVRNGRQRPNILFVLDDQHRPDWLGSLAKAGVRTPNLDALAAGGMLFERAYCASPVCGPSRACLALGTEYDECGVPNHTMDMDASRTTFYRLLRGSGYYVAGCGKFDLAKSSNTWGVDGKNHIANWGFSNGIDNAGKRDAVSSGAQAPKDPYMAFLYQRGLAEEHIRDMKARDKYSDTQPDPLPEDAYIDNWVGSQAMDLLKSCPNDKPWHLVVNFCGPHEPMDVTSRMHKLYRDPAVSFPPPIAAEADESYQETCRNYAAMIENIDAWIGRLVQEVRRRGEMENTYIVFASDHGELLGDFGLWEKVLPYENSVRIPLIVSGPGIPKGIRSDALVSLIDVGATILDWAGTPKAVSMSSVSLAPVLTGGQAGHRPFVRSGLGPWRMVRDGKYKLIVGFDRSMTKRDVMKTVRKPKDSGEPVLLFDLEKDPTETKDIAASHPEEVQRLLKHLYS